MQIGINRDPLTVVDGDHLSTDRAAGLAEMPALAPKVSASADKADRRR